MVRYLACELGDREISDGEHTVQHCFVHPEQITVQKRREPCFRIKSQNKNHSKLKKS